jgi:hypothetical protein
VHDRDLRQILTISLSDIENVSGGEPCDGDEVVHRRLSCLAYVERSDELFRGLSMISLVCFDFISFPCAGVWFPRLSLGNQRTAIAGERKQGIQKLCGRQPA